MVVRSGLRHRFVQGHIRLNQSACTCTPQCRLYIWQKVLTSFPNALLSVPTHVKKTGVERPLIFAAAVAVALATEVVASRYAQLVDSCSVWIAMDMFVDAWVEACVCMLVGLLV